jgi:hypothetical protein
VDQAQTALPGEAPEIVDYRKAENPYEEKYKGEWKVKRELTTRLL